MSKFDPPSLGGPVMNYGSDVPRRRVSGFAVASLVLGILGCIPFITGILAITFGLLGIRKTRDDIYTGRGLAIAGFVLGILSVLGWTGAGSMLGYGYLESKPATVVAKQFLVDLSAGNINAAMANCSRMTAAQLQTQCGQLAQFGTLQSVSISSFNYSFANSSAVMHLEGTCTYSNGIKSCAFDLVKINGKYSVASYRVQ